MRTGIAITLLLSTAALAYADMDFGSVRGGPCSWPDQVQGTGSTTGAIVNSTHGLELWGNCSNSTPGTSFVHLEWLGSLDPNSTLGPGDPIPVSFDFYPSANQGAQFIYDLDILFLSSQASRLIHFGGNLSGSGLSLSYPDLSWSFASMNPTSWGVTLGVSCVLGSCANGFDLIVPQHSSIDINSGNTNPGAQVPEPSSVTLALVIVAAWFGIRRSATRVTRE